MRLIKNIFSPFYYIRTFVDSRLKRSGLKEREIITHDLKIHYWDSETNKPTLILIQAFAAESKYSWHKQVSALSKHFRLVIPNLLYFGNTTSTSKESFSIANQVSLVEALIRHLELEKISLCGASIGGVIAAECAERNPELIEKMILMNCPLKFDAEEDLQKILDEFQLDAKEDLLVPNTPSDLHRLFGISYFKRPSIPRFVFKDIHAELYQNKEEKRQLVRQSSADLMELRNKNYQFDFPVLLVWGERDLLCPLRIGTSLKAHLGKNCQLEIIAKTAHMPNFEKPKQFNKLLLSFLLD